MSLSPTVRPSIPSVLVPDRAPYSGGLESEDMSFRQVIRILRKRYRFICLVAAIVLALVCLASIVLPARYASTSTIELLQDQSDPISGQLGEVVSSVTGQSDLKTDLQTAISTFQDQQLGIEVIERMNIEDRTAAKGLPFWERDKIPAKGDRRPLRQDAVAREFLLKRFERNLDVQNVPDSRLLQVTYKDSDPAFAAAVANAAVDQYIRDKLNRRNIVSMQASEWMGNQLDDLRKQVEAAQQKLVDFQKKSGFIAIPTSMTGGGASTGGAVSQSSSGPELHSPLLDRLLALNQNLVQAQSNRITQEAIYRVAQTQDPDAIAAAATSFSGGASAGAASGGQTDLFGALLALRAQQVALKQQLAASSSIYGAKNPHVTEINQQIAYLDTEVKKEDARILATAASTLQMARATESGIAKEVADMVQQADTINDSAVRLAVLQQEADSSRSLYEDLYTKLQEARLAEETQASDVSVISEALPSSKPTFPNWIINIAAGIGGGILLGALLAFVRDHLDDTIVTGMEIENLTNVPVLGEIPRLDPTSPMLGRKVGFGVLQPERQTTGLLADASSLYADAYRALRTTLLLSQPGSPPRSLLVSSAMPGEGKTTTTYNLALCFAQMDKRVLVIDADMRKSSLEKYGAPRNNMGLSTLLASGSDASEVITPDPRSANLFILSAGPTPPNPTELLSSSLFSELIARFSKEFDLVLIDAPPAMLLADSVVMSTAVDGVLVVVRSGFSTRLTLMRVTEILRRNRAKVLGCVLNDVNTKSSEFYYANGYYGRDYYGKQPQTQF